MRKPKTRREALLFAISALIVGVVTIAFMGSQFAEQRQTSDWLSTTGTVIAHDEVAGGRRGGTHIRVTYEYVLNGGRFTAHNLRPHQTLAFPLGSLPRVDHNNLEELPAIGAPVTVFYDPADPRNACTTTGLDLSQLSLASLLVLICAGGAVWNARTWWLWNSPTSRR